MYVIPSPRHFSFTRNYLYKSINFINMIADVYLLFVTEHMLGTDLHKRQKLQE